MQTIRIICPVLNPDGYKYTKLLDRMWRKNCSPPTLPAELCPGVDLNRNFDFHFGEGNTSPNSCTDTYHGGQPFSEKESKALEDFILNSGYHFKGYITLHSYGQYIFYPYGFDLVTKADNYVELARVGNLAAEVSKPKKFLCNLSVSHMS